MAHHLAKASFVERGCTGAPEVLLFGVGELEPVV
jgi:hypothetical protein